MTTTLESPTAQRTFSYANFGKFEDLHQYDFHGIPGKCFVGSSTGMTAAEVSLNRMPAGRGMPFLHRHRKHEEIYIVIQGRGEFHVDGETFDLRPGSVVRVAPEGVRAIRAGAKEDLHFICVQATAGSKSASNIEDGERVEGEMPW